MLVLLDVSRKDFLTHSISLNSSSSNDLLPPTVVLSPLMNRKSQYWCIRVLLPQCRKLSSWFHGLVLCMYAPCNVGPFLFAFRVGASWDRDNFCNFACNYLAKSSSQHRMSTHYLTHGNKVNEDALLAGQRQNKHSVPFSAFSSYWNPGSLSYFSQVVTVIF